jgi:hypothetical protein
MDQRLVITVNPESDELCGGCHLLKGINVAECQAGFVPRFEGRKTIRPPECCEAVKTLALMLIHLGNLNHDQDDHAYDDV